MAEKHLKKMFSPGCGNRVVTFADVDYAPLNGEAEQYCLVRVWEPA